MSRYGTQHIYQIFILKIKNIVKNCNKKNTFSILFRLNFTFQYRIIKKMNHKEDYRNGICN